VQNKPVHHEKIWRRSFRQHHHRDATVWIVAVTVVWLWGFVDKSTEAPPAAGRPWVMRRHSLGVTLMAAARTRAAARRSLVPCQKNQRSPGCNWPHRPHGSAADVQRPHASVRCAGRHDGYRLQATNNIAAARPPTDACGTSCSGSGG